VDGDVLQQSLHPLGEIVMNLGDTVLFYRNRQAEPLAAIVAKVILPSEFERLSGPAGFKESGTFKPPQEIKLNLFVISEEGIPFNKAKVPLIEIDGTLPMTGGYCQVRKATGEI
jgi:hypothetical protein